MGVQLCRELRNGGNEVVGITHSNGRLLLDRLGVDCRAPEDYQSIGTVNAVVNLAYPSAGSPLDYPAENRKLLSMIEFFASRRSKVVHVSTQAVFGFAFDYPIVCGPLKDRLDYPYVQTKVELENLLMQHVGGRSGLHIVRLGNVWGPGSSTWTTNLVNKISWEQPVGVRNLDGFCNATDVQNVASYVKFLLEKDSTAGTHYHHLAELSDLKWSHWTSLIAATLGRNLVYADASPSKPVGKWVEFRRALSIASPASVGAHMLQERYLGSLMRSVLGRLPKDFVNSVRNLRAPTSFLPKEHQRSDDGVFLDLMSCNIQFSSVVEKDWTPPVNAELSWKNVRQWIEYAGYLK